MKITTLKTKLKTIIFCMSKHKVQQLSIKSKQNKKCF